MAADTDTDTDTDCSFRDALKKAGLSQVEFRDLVLRLSGKAVTLKTISQWATGKTPPYPCALALLVIIRQLPPEMVASFRP